MVRPWVRFGLLSGSVTLMIQAHDWDSSGLTLMGLGGLALYVAITTPKEDDR